MDTSPVSPMNPNTYCLVCGAAGNSRCSRCQVACYCGKLHQVEHWPIHKKNCRKLGSIPAAATHRPITNDAANLPSKAISGADNYSAYRGWCQNNVPSGSIGSVLPDSTCDSNRVDSLLNADKIIDISSLSEDDIFSSFNSEVLSSDNSFWEIINSCDAQNLSELGSLSEREQAIAKISEALQTGAPTPQVVDSSSSNRDVQGLDLMGCASLYDICQNVVHDLGVYGICVLDKFAGEKLGNAVLAEVKQLYNTGIFKQGQLTNPSPHMNSVRKDVTTWVDGSEHGCSAIGILMKKLDVVVTTCNKLPRNGELSRYKLNRRTKAMIACYPGDGTYYKKHIDNPHKDGRCITCIYYLNQNWDIKQQGGLLRMFPTSRNSDVAQIVPVFDRMIFFWSDKRNPHEVLPSFATRFAITVWYFDADERDKAVMVSKQKSSRARNQYN